MAAAEWRRGWPIVLGGMMGYSCVGLQAFALGPFVPSIESEFGWQRAQVMAGLSIASFAGIGLNFLAGWLLDRIGPRKLGLTGQIWMCLSFAALAGATGTMLDWGLHYLSIALGIAMCQGLVWTSLAVRRFERGRGLAIAVVLSGSSLTAAAVPVLATLLIEWFGWRTALALTPLIWLAITLPFTLMLFHDTPDRGDPAADVVTAPRAESSGVPFSEAVRTFQFWIIAFGMFSFILYTMALSPNLVPLLTGKGLDLLAAGRIAALAGISGFAARITIGHLLDRFPAHWVASCCFAFPLVGLALMLIGEPGIGILALSALIFGATVGAENDIIIYMIAKHFGMRSFGILLGLATSISAVAAVVAPFAAGWIYDSTASYDLLLSGLGALMGATALLMPLLRHQQTQRRPVQQQA